MWKSGNPAWQKPQNVRLSEIGEISILELLVPEYQGRQIRQHNMYAQFVVEGYWVDLHLSKVLYQDRDRPLFERMVKSVRFEPKYVIGLECRCHREFDESDPKRLTKQNR